jgi:hypothetical protein
VGSYAAAYTHRYSSGSGTASGSAVLALADVSGFTNVTTAIYQRDLITGRSVPMTPFWRGFNGATGLFQVVCSVQATVNGLQKLGNAAIQISTTPPPALMVAGGGTIAVPPPAAVSFPSPIVGHGTVRLGLSEVLVYCTSKGIESTNPQDEGGPSGTPSTPPLPESLPNQMPLLLEQEMADFAASGAQTAAPGTALFDEMVASGEELIWAVNEAGELRVLPRFVNQIQMKHSMLFGGAKVRAAGEATIAGSSNGYMGLSINNSSGHYQPPASTLPYARYVFGNFGIVFP